MDWPVARGSEGSMLSVGCGWRRMSRLCCQLCGEEGGAPRRPAPHRTPATGFGALDRKASDPQEGVYGHGLRALAKPALTRALSAGGQAAGRPWGARRSTSVALVLEPSLGLGGLKAGTYCVPGPHWPSEKHGDQEPRKALTDPLRPPSQTGGRHPRTRGTQPGQ